MRIFVTFLSAVLCSILVIQAAQQRVEVHGKGFPLNRQVVVVAAEYDNDGSRMITDILDSKGVKYIISQSSKGSKQKIVLSRVNKIEGVNESNAYHIKVTQKKVLIQYTTQLSLDKAIEYFVDLMQENVKVLPGQTVYDWGESKVKKGIIDGVSSYLSVNDVDDILRYYKKNNVMFSVVNSENWRMQSDVFGVVNPQAQVYPSGECYTPDQIIKMMAKHSKLIPMIDLMSRNKVFEQVTGHSQFSVEGMRFVRAIIEEFVSKTATKRLCLGMKSKVADARYIEFLEDLAIRLGIDIIMLD